MSHSALYRELSRRERQIMDALHQNNPLSAKEIQASIPEPPSYSAVRALITRLVDKNVVAYEQQGAKYLYRPVVAEKKIQTSAVARLLNTFFKGSKHNAVTALLDAEGEKMTPGEIAAIERKIAALKLKR